MPYMPKKKKPAKKPKKGMKKVKGVITPKRKAKPKSSPYGRSK